MDDKSCPKCGVRPGQLHHRGCGVEVCPNCGGQKLSCCCEGKPPARDPRNRRLLWTGEWPGEAECREFGWYAKPGPNNQGWVPCQPDEAGAMPDLNRLHIEAVWDRNAQRWVRKEG